MVVVMKMVVVVVVVEAVDIDAVADLGKPSDDHWKSLLLPDHVYTISIQYKGAINLQIHL